MPEEPVIPKTLPTMVWGYDEDPIVLDEIIEAALSIRATPRASGMPG